MAVKKTPSESEKNYHKRYPDVYAKHKKAKLERHVKKFPNDEAAKKKLEAWGKSGVPYTRKTPKTKGGWAHFRYNKDFPHSFDSVMSQLSRREKMSYAESFAFASAIQLPLNVTEKKVKNG